MKVLLALVLATSLLLAGCMQKQSGTSYTSGDLIKEEKPVAGMVWSYPKKWDRSHEMPMRVATYVIPSGLEDMESGECGVFFFGPDQGGDVDMNIQRWGAQFEGAAEAIKNTATINGMEVVYVRIAGTFLAPAGPEMESQGKKPGYKLLGAIVKAPNGMVFFKCTAPAMIIEREEAAFLAMIESIEKS